MWTKSTVLALAGKRWGLGKPIFEYGTTSATGAASVMASSKLLEPYSNTNVLVYLDSVPLGTKRLYSMSGSHCPLPMSLFFRLHVSVCPKIYTNRSPEFSVLRFCDVVASGMVSMKWSSGFFNVNWRCHMSIFDRLQLHNLSRQSLTDILHGFKVDILNLELTNNDLFGCWCLKRQYYDHGSVKARQRQQIPTLFPHFSQKRVLFNDSIDCDCWNFLSTKHTTFPITGHFRTWPNVEGIFKGHGGTFESSLWKFPVRR